MTGFVIQGHIYLILVFFEIYNSSTLWHTHRQQLNRVFFVAKCNWDQRNYGFLSLQWSLVDSVCSVTAGRQSYCVWWEVLHRVLLKHLDACSLNADSWEYNLHVGRAMRHCNTFRPRWASSPVSQPSAVTHQTDAFTLLKIKCGVSDFW